MNRFTMFLYFALREYLSKLIKFFINEEKWIDTLPGASRAVEKNSPWWAPLFVTFPCQFGSFLLFGALSDKIKGKHENIQPKTQVTQVVVPWARTQHETVPSSNTFCASNFISPRYRFVEIESSSLTRVYHAESSELSSTFHVQQITGPVWKVKSQQQTALHTEEKQ